MSRVSLREKCAVDEWLASGKALHSMRDHPAHKWKIMAGMYGLRPAQLFGHGKKTMRQLIDEFEKTGEKPDDQRFLAAVIWPMAYNTSNWISHDAFLCDWVKMRGLGISFPCPRTFVHCPCTLKKWPDAKLTCSFNPDLGTTWGKNCTAGTTGLRASTRKQEHRKHAGDARTGFMASVQKDQCKYLASQPINGLCSRRSRTLFRSKSGVLSASPSCIPPPPSSRR
jgi:hypothetical protein